MVAKPLCRTLEHDALEVKRSLVAPLVTHPVHDTLAVVLVGPCKACGVVIDVVFQPPRLHAALSKVGVVCLPRSVGVLVQRVLAVGPHDDVERMVGRLCACLLGGRHVVRDAIPTARRQPSLVGHRLQLVMRHLDHSATISWPASRCGLAVGTYDERHPDVGLLALGPVADDEAFEHAADGDVAVRHDERACHDVDRVLLAAACNDVVEFLQSPASIGLVVDLDRQASLTPLLVLTHVTHRQRPVFGRLDFD